MTEAERTRLARLYELQDWDIHLIVSEVRLPDCYGQVQIDGSAKRAHVEVYTGVHTDDRYTVEETYEHELVETKLWGDIFHGIDETEDMRTRVDLVADYVRRVAARAFDAGKQSRGKR